MKFKALEDIKTKATYGLLLEEGNTFDSERRGIPDETVERWYEAGWVQIEGRDPAPERKPGAQRIQPRGAKE